MTKGTALIILALIILMLPVICVYAWVVDMSSHNRNVLVAIQTVIYVGWAIHQRYEFLHIPQKIRDVSKLTNVPHTSYISSVPSPSLHSTIKN